jgi:hypothetical protein
VGVNRAGLRAALGERSRRMVAAFLEKHDD